MAPSFLYGLVGAKKGCSPVRSTDLSLINLASLCLRGRHGPLRLLERQPRVRMNDVDVEEEIKLVDACACGRAVGPDGKCLLS